MSSLTIRRALASSALLSRSWSAETVVTLKEEARSRGLSTKGNKAALVSRLEEHDRRAVHISPVPARAASTSNPVTSKPAPTPTPRPEPSELAKSFYSVKLPSADFPEPEAPVQVPYVPDFWASSSASAHAQETTPKLLVVAGATTHHGGGPSHSLLLDDQNTFETSVDLPPQPASAQPSPSSAGSRGGLLSDMADDLGFQSSGKGSVWKWFS